MSFLSPTAIAIMLKPMFPAIWEAVDRLEADGTIAKLETVFRSIATNGTAEQLVQLASKLERFIELMERMEAKEKTDGYALEPGPVAGNAGLLTDDRFGVLGTDDPT